MPKIAIVLGSVRSERVGIRVARYLMGRSAEQGFEPTLVDPVEYDLPLLDRMYKDYAPGEAPEPLERLAQVIKAADGYLVLSAEYNHSIPPALSNLLDHFLDEYFFKPSAIACYSVGGFGGVRAAMQLRAMLAEMGMSSIPSLLPFPKVTDLLDEEGRPLEGKAERLAKNADRFLGEFRWYVEALAAKRAEGTPY